MHAWLIVSLSVLLTSLHLHPGQTWHLLWKVPVNGSKLSADNLGNPFVIQGDELSKFRDDGSFYRRYSNKTLGAISSLDLRNPLKVLVFYKDFSKIVFLDNTLSENGSPIYLEELNLAQASLVCTSFDNGFWVFDPIHYTLIRYNQKLMEVVNVPNLNQWIGGRIEPNSMTEYENKLYINDPGRGLLVFDIFGTYEKTIPLIGIQKFQVIGEVIYFSDGQEKIKTFGMKTIREELLPMPDANYEDWQIGKDRLYLLGADTLYAYRFQFGK